MKLRSTFGLLILIASIVFGAFEYSAGKRAWAKAEAAFIADGESLDPNIRFAAPVADEKNFAAIPQLIGITRDDLEGENIRHSLKAIELRHPEIRFPRLNHSRGKALHAPRARYDLRGLHNYLREAGLLELSAMPEQFGTDIFNGMEKAHGDLISALLAASDRPHAICQPPLRETFKPGSMIFAQSSPHLQTLQGLSKGLGIYTVAAIHSDHPEKAAQGIGAMLRLSQASIADGTMLIHYLVATAIRAMAVEPMWQGLEMKVWDADQLLALQTKLEAISPRTDFADSLRGEIIGQIDLYEFLKANSEQVGEALMMDEVTPLGLLPFLPWIDHNKARGLHSYHKGFISPLKGKLSYIEIGKLADEETKELLKEPSWHPRKILVRLSFPVMVTAVKKTAQSEANLTQATIACALERYFIENRSYPDTLQALVPKFATEIPLDPMDNQPMRYQKTNDGRYQLHSIGWDNKDDDAAEGDITWSYKAREAKAKPNGPAPVRRARK